MASAGTAMPPPRPQPPRGADGARRASIPRRRRVTVLTAVLAMLAGLLLAGAPLAAAAQVPVPSPPPPPASSSSAPATTAEPTPTGSAVPGAAGPGPVDLGQTVPGSVPLPPAGTQEPTGQTCFLIVDKVRPGQTRSDVVGSGCHTGAKVPPAQVPTNPGAGPTGTPGTGPTRFRAQAPMQTLASTVALAELYADTNYGGKSFIVYGNQGPCDASGYTISDSTTANTTVGGISSFRAYNGCNNQKLYNQTNLSGAPAGYIGAGSPGLPAAYDNKVLSLRLRTNCTTYSSTASVCGAIRDKYEALGGPTGPLGYPTSNELTNPDNVGKRNTFQNQGAAIYWSPTTGANQIQGLIIQKWGQLGYETGILGYPTSDELTNPDQTGKRNTFANNGAIYYGPRSGAHQVSGAIYQNWGQWGWEKSPVGYPLSDEVDNTTSPYAQYGSRRNDFQMGQIYNNNGTVSRGVWAATTGAPASFSKPIGNMEPAAIAAPAVGAPALATQSGAGCPSGTTNYPAPKQIYNCLVVVTDTTGYAAGIRAGFSAHNGNPNPPQDDNVSTLEPFGSAHAADDHNVLFRNQQLVIQDAKPYRDMNAPDYLRYLYTMTFQIEGNPTNSINVVVQKQPDVNFQAPDGDDMGLITGYCSRGAPNPMNYQGFCPSNLPPPFGNGPGGMPQ